MRETLKPGTRCERCGSIWDPFHGGHNNYSIQAPGERVEPLPGQPIYPDHWTVALWWPGRGERVVVCADEDAALNVIRGCIGQSNRVF